MSRSASPSVLLAYAAFVLIGINSGSGGVLLVAQMSGYGVDRTTIGITFFIGAAGYVAGGFHTGGLVQRFGFRLALVIGGAAFAVSGLYLASRPPFMAFLLVQLVLGYGCGILESALNAYLASLPDARAQLNKLHAFFGVGALIGPVLAAWIVGLAPWTVVWLVMVAICVPIVVGFWLVYPSQPVSFGGHPAEAAATQSAAAVGPLPDPPSASAGGLLGAALRERGVLFGALFLAVYVGLEISMGNWSFSYLVQGRELSRSLAGYSVSGYWLGLTVGRFVISPVAARIGASTGAMVYTCLFGVVAAITLAWLAPTAALASAALVLLGFFLGPIFPTTMAIVPQLTEERLVPTAFGVLNAGALMGGALLPWLAGAITQSTAIWVLLPFTLALGGWQFAAWRPLARRIRTQPGKLSACRRTGPGRSPTRCGTAASTRTCTTRASTSTASAS
jgi:fucose permease